LSLKKSINSGRESERKRNEAWLRAQVRASTGQIYVAKLKIPTRKSSIEKQNKE
jgi:hypothetical protein